jgi:coproporphyrinogen III oxidase
MKKCDTQCVKDYLLGLQESLTRKLLKDDPQLTVQQDQWQRPNHGGEGISCAFSNGIIYEKAGVNFSHVFGKELPAGATVHRPDLTNSAFEALGISIIIHPVNPMVPTCHANLRLFSATTENRENIWWFGGGFDLTPYYGFKEDCIHWHKAAKQACEGFGEEVYIQYKEWADRYFYLKHRQEPRGIGGLFFDELNQWPFETCVNFIKSIGEHFAEAYFPIVALRKNHSYDEQQRQFQLYRRGRYVEFNLLQDRGTLFGLQFGGRIESILISLPPLVTWQYNWQPAPGSREEELYHYYLKPQDWANLKDGKDNFEK